MRKIRKDSALANNMRYHQLERRMAHGEFFKSQRKSRFAHNQILRRAAELEHDQIDFIWDEIQKIGATK